MSENPASARLLQNGCKVLTFFDDAILLSGRSAESASATVRDRDGELVCQRTSQAFIVP
jgi:hypothetical protein